MKTVVWIIYKTHSDHVGANQADKVEHQRLSGHDSGVLPCLEGLLTEDLKSALPTHKDDIGFVYLERKRSRGTGKKYK